MAITHLKRKALKNRTRARVRQEDIKRLTARPVIKNVDIEKIKEEFEANKKAAEKKAAPKAGKNETVVAEVAPEAKVKVETAEKKEKHPEPKAEAPKAEKKAAKKPADKKEDQAE